MRGTDIAARTGSGHRSRGSRINAGTPERWQGLGRRRSRTPHSRVADEQASGLRAALAAALAVIAGLALYSAAPASAATQPGISTMAYGFLFDGSATAKSHDGGNAKPDAIRWLYPGCPSWAAGVLGQVHPGFLRISQPLNVMRDAQGNVVRDDQNRAFLETGYPGHDVAGCPGEDLMQYLQNLKDGGVKLGASLSTTTNGTDAGTPRALDQMLLQAKLISEVQDKNNNPLYSYLFLDHTGHVPTDQQQLLINGLGTAQGGNWNRVLTNDTPFNPDNLPTEHPVPATGQWAHARELEVLTDAGGPGCPSGQSSPMPDWECNALAAAAGPARDALTQKDAHYIHYINTHDPGSHPILKPEVSSESDRLAQLPLWAQCNLLGDWAHDQAGTSSNEPFTFIFPLYTPANHSENEDHAYNALYQGNDPSKSCTNASASDPDPTYGGSTFTYNLQWSLISPSTAPG